MPPPAPKKPKKKKHTEEDEEDEPFFETLGDRKKDDDDDNNDDPTGDMEVRGKNPESAPVLRPSQSKRRKRRKAKVPSPKVADMMMPMWTAAAGLMSLRLR